MQKIKVIISGCNGSMGRAVARMCRERGTFDIVAGLDLLSERADDFPVYAHPLEFSGKADVLIDFSNPDALDALLDYCVSTGTPAVICTTGHSEIQLQKLRAATEKIPVFRSGNMSIGINLMLELVRRTASILGANFDVEIVERHHRRKLDAPSGTALMLADAAAGALPRSSEYVYERQSKRQPRDEGEIGISSVRGGTIVGEHEVIFAGPDEVIELKHAAHSREVFANGAVAAAAFMAGVRKPGLYDMGDLLSSEIEKS